MELTEIREEIDQIDSTLIDAFIRRMDIADEVAKAKAKTGKRIFDPERERNKLLSVAERVPDRYKPQAISLFSLLMSMSKTEQARYIASLSASDAVPRTAYEYVCSDKPFPATATVACQGVEGAYSQIAACRLFEVPGITFFDTFEGVFKAVSDGFCEFGVLPIENSTAGSVNAVYDLLAKYKFSIERALRLKIDHNLLAKHGASITDIHEVVSHEQALAQCESYLKGLGVRTTVVENTARAAEIVSASERKDLAALSSRDCASLYGLDVLQSDVQDNDNNYTRFVVISRKNTVYPGATKASLMLTLESKPGALYHVLECFYALDINLVKLESRPIPSRNNEFMFYFDLECPSGTDGMTGLLATLDDMCPSLTYFGSYAEVL